MKIGSRSSCALAARLVALVGLAATSIAFADGRVEPVKGPMAETSFLAAHPGAAFYRSEGRITTVYGPAFAQGQNPIASAEAFLAAHAGMLGIGGDELSPGSLASDHAHTHEMMFDPDTGTYKFTLVSYLQMHHGIPVFQSDVRLLVRNETGSPLVLVRSALRDLGAFQADEHVAAEPNVGAALAAAMKEYPGIGDFSAPRVIVFAGTSDVPAPARLALEFEGTVGDVFGATYEKWKIVADAATGAVIWSNSLIDHTNVTGSVKAMATPGYKADICATEVLTPLPYARATIGATTAYADVNGNFTITNAGTSQVTVGSELRGRWFRVWNSAAAGANPSIMSKNVTPPGPADFVHNPSNNNATILSGTNAYIGANKVRDYALTYKPNFPSISTQQEFRVNINVSGSCNAFYDGSSINFYASGGGCPSTAFGDVVYHEYGHHMVNVSGSGQGQYGEGYGDLNGVMMDDDPVLGYGFQSNCGSGIRTANNNLQYPCTGEIHSCGQLLTGCFWSTRAQMLAPYPSTYRAILSGLAVNSVGLHSGDLITPQITIDVLTLDDNDSDITNGTPHYTQIQAGFSAHNMPGPAVNALSISFPDGLPQTIDPDGGTSFNVVVTPNMSNTLNTSSGKFYVDKESDGTYVSSSMQYLGNNTFKAVFPAVTCNSPVRFYVEAKTGSGSTFQGPFGAPSSYFTTVSARSLTSSYSDNSETNPGWVSTFVGTASFNYGVWERAIPAAGTNGPASDADGSGMCWVTSNLPSSNFKSNPKPTHPVTLTSPALDGSFGDAVFTYSRWISIAGSSGGDSLVVQASNNGGATWVTVETVTTSAPNWASRSYRIADYLPATSNMKFRFTVADEGVDSVVEVGLDSFSIGVVTCYCPADFDLNGFVNGDDFDGFMAAFGLGDISADFDQNGFVNGDDFDGFTVAFNTGC